MSGVFYTYHWSSDSNVTVNPKYQISVALTVFQLHIYSTNAVGKYIWGKK